MNAAGKTSSNAAKAAPAPAANVRAPAAAAKAPAGIQSAGNQQMLNALGMRGRMGEPLAPSVRRHYEAFFGAELSATRIHTDDAAHAAAQSVSATAFAHGNDVYFGAGRFAPESREGSKLLAHELAHVVQQRGAARSSDAKIQRQATAPPLPKSPSDVDLGFNALDASHRLIESIDQSQITYEDDPNDKDRYFKRKRLVRHVDFPAVLAVLDNLTAGQVKEVEAEYAAYHHRHPQHTLRNDLFGGGERRIWTDLTVDQIYRLKALMAGTVASSEEDAEAAAKHKREGDVAELHALLYGRLGAGEIERVMTLLRRPGDEATAILNEYDLNYDLRSDLFRMGIANAIRAMMLLSGSSMAADAYAIGMARSRIIAIDEALKALKPTERTLTTVLVSVGEALSPTAALERRRQIDALTAERKALVESIEQRVQLVAGEAKREAELEGKDALDTDVAIRTRVSWVLGAEGAVQDVVGGTSAKLIGAVAANDPAEQVAAQLRKLEEAGKLTTEAMTDAFRALRMQAAEETRRRYPDATADELEEEERKLSDQWFIRLRSTWDAAVVGEGRTFSQILDRGDQTEVDVKRGLYMASGQLGPADELVLALAGGRKDMETVKRVLHDKSADQIAELKLQYQQKTKQLPHWPMGRSLEVDLFGTAPTKAGEKQEIDYWTMRPKGPQGKASGTDRLILEDYLQRPSREGGMDEVDYIAGRAEREYQYTIDNRGATGWWRDHWGNEARSLLDATIKEVRQLRAMYMTATRAGTDQEAVKSAGAHGIIRRMHLARATIRGDRAGYEKATAELRATFQAIASFVLQAVLTAVLTPFATALFAARLGKLAAMASRWAQAGAKFATWSKNTVVGMASTITANKTVYGNDYNTDMLFHDLKGGLGSAIGATGVQRLLGPVTQRLTDRLGKTLGGEVIAGAKTAGGMEVTGILEGEPANLFENFLENHFTGKLGDVITHGTTKLTGLGPKPVTRGVAAEEPHVRASGAGAEHEAGPARPADTGAADVDIPAAPEIRTPMKLEETRTPMALEPRPAKSHEAQKGRATALPEAEAARPPTAPDERAVKAAAAPEPTPEVAPTEDLPDTEGPVRVEPEPGHPGSGGRGGGGQGPSSGGSGGGGRKPPGPVDPTVSGIPESSSEYLQLAADQLDIVIRVRPVNVHSLAHMDAGIPVERRALPKMELVKAKTVNDMDLLVGAPKGSRGLVALFRPVPPSSALPSSTKRRAWKRYFQRLSEYHALRAEYGNLEKQGIVRIEDGLLKVADPRMAGGPGEPHGKFRPVAGDIDIFDITHSDGSPLQPHERAEVIRILRSMGIGVEHGAHVWWEQQSPETYDPEMDRRIREEHMSADQLVAFAPGTQPQGVWADTPVRGVPRQPGQRMHAPASSTAIEGSDITALGPGTEGGYIELTEGGGGGGTGGSASRSGQPQEPPGRPAHFAPWKTIDARLQAVQMPMRGRARVAAYLLLRRYPQWVRLDGESGVAGGHDTPRTELTLPPRHIVAPRPPDTYGPDAPVAGHHPGPRAHDAEANLLEQVAAQLQPGDTGELHIRTNFPTCPSCIEAFHRFTAAHPGIVIVSHTPARTLAGPHP